VSVRGGKEVGGGRGGAGVWGRVGEGVLRGEGRSRGQREKKGGEGEKEGGCEEKRRDMMKGSGGGEEGRRQMGGERRGGYGGEGGEGRGEEGWGGSRLGRTWMAGHAYTFVRFGFLAGRPFPPYGGQGGSLPAPTSRPPQGPSHLAPNLQVREMPDLSRGGVGHVGHLSPFHHHSPPLAPTPSSIRAPSPVCPLR